MLLLLLISITIMVRSAYLHSAKFAKEKNTQHNYKLNVKNEKYGEDVNDVYILHCIRMGIHSFRKHCFLKSPYLANVFSILVPVKVDIRRKDVPYFPFNTNT